MITFNTINVAMPDLDQAKVSIWIDKVAASFGKRIDLVNYIRLRLLSIVSTRQATMNLS